ncbi:serine-rich adhesin for platelets-like isoform X2 [Euwallacea fornicatus]|uniref:serine-rich adhesin for platelets-like isoform X2 n=1 Tax=Euwallacea fornicatus TaxID=995702 RepID=UPI00338F8A4C
MKDGYFQCYEEPLCSFCVSDAFFIRGVSSPGKTQTAPSGRQFTFSIPSRSGSRFGRNKRQRYKAAWILNFTELFSTFKRRKCLTLEEILSIVQNAWQGPEFPPLRIPAFDVNDMEHNKSLSTEMRSPIPQRRRLSLPEEIMRKHNLAMERANHSQETKQWDKGAECSSDPNLCRKKDSNLMRKSTLLRRLWGDTHKSKLSGSFQEWQHSYKRLSSTQSLSSAHSSPEHLRKFDLPLHKKFSSIPNRSSSSRCEDKTSPKRNGTSALKSVSKTSYSGTRESPTKYTVSSYTNVSGSNSDSAYSNSFSGGTTSKNDDNGNPSRLTQESAVQTGTITNLNVISNVCLSQSTLDVIFKEVMKDVNTKPHGDISISNAIVTYDDNSAEIKLDKAPKFSFDSQNANLLPHVEKLIISKVRAGSPYGKPDPCVSPPSVPRFSAVPRTTSMEVNTSEEDKEESDTASFVDSLEDFSSPGNVSKSRASISDVEQLLPEGRKATSSTSSRKSSMFFIPIEDNRDKETKSVSELLPMKVREKLTERQQKREEKLKQYRHSIPLTTSNVNMIKSSLNIVNQLPKKRSKPVLPSIALLKRSSAKESPSARKKDSQPSQSTAKFSPTKQCSSEKRIEILHVMEYVEIPDTPRKSKIPVPVNTCSPKKTEFDKPSYLDLDNNRPSDHKIDQLIANILIDSLQHDEEAAKYEDIRNANPDTDATSKIPKIKESKNDNDAGNGNIDEEKKFLASSVPKRWVTVYTAQKDLQAPESTSDEGKKDLVDTGKGAEEVKKEKIVNIRDKRALNNIENKTKFGFSSYNNSFGEVQHPRGDKKEERKRSTGEWSVTISGSNTYGQLAPDVEMRLKFPKKHRSSSSSSFEKENSDNSFRFPKIEQPRFNNVQKRYSKERHKREEILPKIPTSKDTINKAESSVLSMTPSLIMPRQNRTSTSRYYFSRPRRTYSLPEVPPVINGGQYYEIIKRIPDILAITGRSISPELRSFEER